MAAKYAMICKTAGFLANCILTHPQPSQLCGYQERTLMCTSLSKEVLYDVVHFKRIEFESKEANLGEESEKSLFR